MKRCEYSLIVLLSIWLAALISAEQPKAKDGSRMPTVQHTKTPGSGYEKGSPLYERQVTLKKANVPSQPIELQKLQGVFAASGGEFKGYLPHSRGPSPLFIWLPGEHDDFWAPIYQYFTYQMALRGFAAASIRHDNWEGDAQLCRLKSKADRIFKGPDGALATLCARTDIDCSKGVAVAGHGQGAILTMFSAQSDVRVTAQLVLSGSSGDGGSHVTCAITAPDHCLWNANLTDGGLHQSKRRYLIGIDDSLMGGNPEFVPNSMKRVSGYDCGEDFDCIQADGSGYFIVRGSDLTGAKCDKVRHPIAWTVQPVKAESELICDWLSEKKFGIKANFDWLAATALTSGLPPAQANLTFEGGPIPCAKSCPAAEEDMCQAASNQFAISIVSGVIVVVLGGLLLAFAIYYCCVQKVQVDV